METCRTFYYFKYKIIHYKIVNFVGYCIINSHLMYGNEYHKKYSVLLATELLSNAAAVDRRTRH
jgi:hypothetical protein